MNPFFDIAYNSINKNGEELCGDHVEMIQKDHKLFAVLSDGLGSGVKANILSTLTSKIAITMLSQGAKIEETMDTIVNTLPECNIRKLAYSTFTLLKIDDKMNMYVAEYDNPPIFIYRDGFLLPFDKKEKEINGKRVFESHVKLKIGDMIAVVSDGAVHAGVGATLNFGWQLEDISKYLMELNRVEKTSGNIAGSFIDVCNNLYQDRPGDDTTILTIKIRKPEYIDLFTGPPEEKDMDSWIIRKMENASGKKIICGGTTANIAARELERNLDIKLHTITKEVPPVAYMKGYDLITEGVLTLQRALKMIKKYGEKSFDIFLKEGEDAGTILAKTLLEDCTHLNLWFGKAVNPAHQNPYFPIDFNIKLKIVTEIMTELRKLGKQVQMTYI